MVNASAEEVPPATASTAAKPRSGPVLLALRGAAEPRVALGRAAQLARGLGVELTVLRVWGSLGLSEPATGTDLVARTLAWIARDLGDDAPKAHVLVSGSGFDGQVVHAARQLGAALVVLASEAEQRPEHATYLALRSGVPVLVARPALAAGAIVAATDLDTSDFPVLRQAARLSRELHVPAVFVHNLAPDPEAPRAPLVDAATRTLERVGAELAPGAARRICEAPSPSDAVLAIADQLEADLIVVGARQRSWLGRMLGGLMAERTAWRARSSVLIVPMPAVGVSCR